MKQQAAIENITVSTDIYRITSVDILFIWIKKRKYTYGLYHRMDGNVD